MPDKLPNGWVKTTLGDVAESMKNGIYKPASFYADDGLACLRMYNIGDGQIIWRDIKRMRLSENEIRDYELLPGDLLVNRVNSRELVGKAAIIPAGLERCVFESKNIRVRLRREMVVPAFVSYRLLLAGTHYFVRNAQQVVGMASINQPQVARFPLPLPPRTEQERIVAKLDALLSRLASGEAAARRAQERLKRYRAAVLHAAVSGELTREWRKSHKPDETGAHLLRRLLQQRRARWEEAELKRLHAAGKQPKDERWKERYDEPAPPKTKALPELPVGWAWASLGQLLSLLRNGIGIPPNEESGLPALRISAVRPMLVDLNERRYFSKSLTKKFEEFALNEGDLLFTRYNGSKDLAGVCGCVPALSETLVHPDKLIRCVVVPGFAPLDRFVEIAANCGVSRKTIASSLRTTAGQWGLSGSVLKEIPIPLPPIDEQGAIVNEVERRLIAAHRLAATLDRQLARALATRQSLLREAFAGRLVPQDPKDEPASVLLARIHAARKVQPVSQPPRRARKLELVH